MRTVLIASLLAAATTLLPSNNVTPSFETDVQILPTMSEGYPLTWHDPPTYTCTATVTTPITPFHKHRTALGVGKLVVAPGHHESQSASWNGYDVQFSVKINREADRADATVTLLRGGDILTRQNTTVWLDRSAPRPAQ